MMKITKFRNIDGVIKHTYKNGSKKGLQGKCSSSSNKINIFAFNF